MTEPKRWESSAVLHRQGGESADEPRVATERGQGTWRAAGMQGRVMQRRPRRRQTVDRDKQGLRHQRQWPMRISNMGT